MSMASNPQVILKHFKASVNNIQLVAKSLLSYISNNQCIVIHNGQSERVHSSAVKVSHRQVERLPLPNKINLIDMNKWLTTESHMRLSHLLQIGFLTSLTKSRKESSVVAALQGVQNCGRKENILAMNNTPLTKVTSVTFWQFQSNTRLYSTDSSENKRDIATSNASSGSVNDDKNEPLGRKEKLKQAVKDYGSTVVIFYIGISLISFGCFYLLVSGGLDIVGMLERFGWGDSALSNKLAAGASTVVVAYAVHMLFASLRVSVTLAAAPFIVRYLRNKGFLKKPLGKK